MPRVFLAHLPLPVHHVIQAPPHIQSNGLIYGIISDEGIYEHGTLFRNHRDGTGYELVFSFPDLALNIFGETGFLQSSDGWLYGAADGPDNSGNLTLTVFKLRTNGTGFTVLRSARLDWPKDIGFVSRMGLKESSDGGTLRDISIRNRSRVPERRDGFSPLEGWQRLLCSAPVCRR